MNPRAVFWEEADARAVAERLRADGFGADLGRERFAGEDDDEDQPWTVRTDAPDSLLELLAERYDGWLERDDPAPPPADPPPLPDAPRRVKGHFPRD